MSSQDLISVFQLDQEKPNLGNPVSIRSHWLFKVFGWFTAIFWILIAVISVIAGSWETGLSFLAFSLLGVFLLLMARQSIIADQFKITIINPIVGRYEIRWQEITKVEFSRNLTVAVFHGSDKWLVMPMIVPFVSGSPQQMSRYLAESVLQYKIPVEFSSQPPRFHKNTRVGW